MFLYVCCTILLKCFVVRSAICINFSCNNCPFFYNFVNYCRLCNGSRYVYSCIKRVQVNFVHICCTVISLLRICTIKEAHFEAVGYSIKGSSVCILWTIVAVHLLPVQE